MDRIDLTFATHWTNTAQRKNPHSDNKLEMCCRYKGLGCTKWWSLGTTFQQLSFRLCDQWARNVRVLPPAPWKASPQGLQTWLIDLSMFFCLERLSDGFHDRSLILQDDRRAIGESISINLTSLHVILIIWFHFISLHFRLEIVPLWHTGIWKTQKIKPLSWQFCSLHCAVRFHLSATQQYTLRMCPSNPPPCFVNKCWVWIPLVHDFFLQTFFLTGGQNCFAGQFLGICNAIGYSGGFVSSKDARPKFKPLFLKGGGCWLAAGCTRPSLRRRLPSSASIICFPSHQLPNKDYDAWANSQALENYAQHFPRKSSNEVTFTCCSTRQVVIGQPL